MRLILAMILSLIACQTTQKKEVDSRPFVVDEKTIQIVGNLDAGTGLKALHDLTVAPADKEINVYIEGISFNPETALKFGKALASKNTRCFTPQAVGQVLTLFQACKTRLVLDGSKAAIATKVRAQVSQASAEDLRKVADELDKMFNDLYELASNKNGISKENFAKLDNKVYQSGQDIVTDGFADSVVELSCSDSTLAKTTFVNLTIPVNTPQGQDLQSVGLEISMCPIQRSFIGPKNISPNVLKYSMIPFFNLRQHRDSEAETLRN